MESDRPYLSVQDSSEISIGQDIIVVGYPLINMVGYNPRVTEGIISAKVGLKDEINAFQISASIQPGNSGGPIIDDEYKVVGIASYSLGDGYAYSQTGAIPQNVNFGIKCDYLKILLSSQSQNIDLPDEEIQFENVEEVLDATGLVLVNVDKLPDNVEDISTPEIYGVSFSYRYNWDVFHYQLLHFKIQIIEPGTNKVLASAMFTGDSPSGANSTAKKTTKKLISQIKGEL